MSGIFKTLSDGSRIPWLAFGTGTALYNREATESVTRAIKLGITHIDTAQMYANEESVGKALAQHPRESLFVTTKLASLQPGETVKQSLTAALKKLGLEYVDLYLIHTPVPHEGRIQEVWKQFEEVKREGLAKNIGVSNFRLRDLQTLLETATIVPAVNQVEFHPYVYEYLKPLAELQKKHNIAFESYGGLTPIVRKAGGPIDSVVETIRTRLEKDRGKPVSAVQALFKWLYAKDVIAAVSTSSKEERIREYLEVSEVPDLTAEEVNAIDEAGAKLHFRNFMKHMDV